MTAGDMIAKPVNTLSYWRSSAARLRQPARVDHACITRSEPRRVYRSPSM